ncbi:MAG: threonylcarbamoyl-AMP synthase, partial [Clostridium sp.]|nr:threonylcarbamoyl-AMP synthase [Clostridium sp.]
GGDAFNPSSSRRIYEAKGRPSDNPLIVHIAKWEDLSALVSNIPAAAKQLADAFWPGPLTMILQKSDRVPDETTGGLSTVAVRMPDHPIALSLIEKSGGYVAAPSANTSGRPSPTLASHVLEDLDGRIDMILDAGAVPGGIESTIVDLTGSQPVILRPGLIPSAMIEAVLAKSDLSNQTRIQIQVDNDRKHFVSTRLRSDDDQHAASDNQPTVSDDQAPPRAPGMKYRHYAPRGELTIVSGLSDQVISYINHRVDESRAQGSKTGVLASNESSDRYSADLVLAAGESTDGAQIAANLYRALREFDDHDISVIFAEAFENQELSDAIMNRLTKAAKGRRIYLQAPTQTEEETK